MKLGSRGRLVARLVLSAAFAAGVGALPIWVDNRYLVHLMNLAVIYAITAMGLNLLSGVAGQISLGQAAFVGLGGYAVAILNRRYGWPFCNAAAVAVAVGALGGLVLGVPSLRVRGHYLGMVTLGFAQIFSIVAVNWDTFTGGAGGIPRIPAPAVGGMSFDSESSFLGLAAAVGWVCYLALSGLTESNVGRTLRAIREDEVAALSVGIRASYYKVLAFVISSAFAALSGVLFVGFLGVASPDSFNIGHSIQFLIMIVIGGLGSIGGAVFGAIVVTLLPEYLRGLEQWYQFGFGIGIVALAIFLPGGIAGLSSRAWEVVAGVSGRARRND